MWANNIKLPITCIHIRVLTLTLKYDLFDVDVDVDVTRLGTNMAVGRHSGAPGKCIK